MNTVNRRDNIRRIHENALTPDPLYNRKPLEWFIGRCVKMPFQSADSHVEHMWVQIIQRLGDNLLGTLDNNPVVVDGMKRGDPVIVKRVEIEAVTLSKEEWLAELKQLWAEGDILPYPKDTNGLEEAYEEGWTPRQALRWWKKREQIEDRKAAS